MKTTLSLLLAAGGFALLAGGTTRAPAQQTFYGHGEPTPDEQFMLELINAARANPAATGAALAATGDPFMLNAYRFYGVDTSLLRSQFAAYPARPPLAFHPALMAAARRHTADMVARNFQSHNGSDGSTSFSRVRDAGYFAPVTENVAGPANYPSHEAVLDGGYLVDWGVPAHDHRDTILDVGTGYPVSVEVGIGCGAGYSDTQEFGFYFQNPPRYLTGVAYRDSNANGRYDQGEGLSGVTIQVEGNSAYTVTGASGGYALPLDRTGAISAQAFGGPLGDLRVALAGATAGENVKWDLVWSADGTPPAGAFARAGTTVSVVATSPGAASWSAGKAATSPRI